MAGRYVKVFTDFAEQMETLNDAEAGRLFRAMLEYADTGIEPKLCGNERVLWPTARLNIDRCNQAYARQCEANAENGVKGGRPKKPNETEKTHSVFEKPNETEKTLREDKEEVKKKTPTVSKEKPSAFRPPTLDEVEAYCRERGNGVDARRFYDYYSEAGWTDQSGHKVRNWKQKMIAVWERKPDSQPVKKGEKSEQAERDYTTAPDGMRLIL